MDNWLMFYNLAYNVHSDRYAPVDIDHLSSIQEASGFVHIKLWHFQCIQACKYTIDRDWRVCRGNLVHRHRKSRKDFDITCWCMILQTCNWHHFCSPLCIYCFHKFCPVDTLNRYHNNHPELAHIFPLDFPDGSEYIHTWDDVGMVGSSYFAHKRSEGDMDSHMLHWYMLYLLDNCYHVDKLLYTDCSRKFRPIRTQHHDDIEVRLLYKQDWDFLCNQRSRNKLRYD